MTSRAWVFLFLLWLPGCAQKSATLSPCEVTWCQHGGLCVTDDVGVASCQCKEGWSGTGCGIAKACEGAACGPGVLHPETSLDLGRDNTGDRTCNDGGDGVAYAVAALTRSSATLAKPSSPGCLAVGDEILLVNLQGSATAVFNTGEWELLRVDAVEGAVVRFASDKTRSYGSALGSDAGIGTGPGLQRVVLQRVPHYAAVALDADRVLTAPAWNGVVGGVLALRVDRGVDAAIDMSGRGFRGGATTSPTNSGGQQGESLRGLGVVSALANNGGGGGGTPGDECASSGKAGGGGAYATAVADGMCAGASGVPYGDDLLTKIFLGSGGGAGATAMDTSLAPLGGAGGAGGGIVLVLSGAAVAASMSARGQSGVGDVIPCSMPSPSSNDCWDDSGPGGGGAGGSILVRAPDATGTTSVEGGSGGLGLARRGAAGGLGRALRPLAR